MHKRKQKQPRKHVFGMPKVVAFTANGFLSFSPSLFLSSLFLSAGEFLGGHRSADSNGGETTCGCYQEIHTVSGGNIRMCVDNSYCYHMLSLTYNITTYFHSLTTLFRQLWIITFQHRWRVLQHEQLEHSHGAVCRSESGSCIPPHSHLEGILHTCRNTQQHNHKHTLKMPTHTYAHQTQTYHIYLHTYTHTSHTHTSHSRVHAILQVVSKKSKAILSKLTQLFSPEHNYRNYRYNTTHNIHRPHMGVMHTTH